MGGGRVRRRKKKKQGCSRIFVNGIFARERNNYIVAVVFVVKSKISSHVAGKFQVPMPWDRKGDWGWGVAGTGLIKSNLPVLKFLSPASPAQWGEKLKWLEIPVRQSRRLGNLTCGK